MPPIDYSNEEEEDKEEKKADLTNDRNMQTNFANIVIGEPTPLWMLVTDWPDVFEKHVLLSRYLNKNDIKMFYGSCRASRRAVKRAKIKLRETFRVEELSSISTMELAWEGYPWGERRRFPDGGEVITMNQEFL